VAELAILADAEALARHVADWLVARVLGTKGRFGLVLSGGSTPRRLYQCLAESPWRERMPWQRLHLFWGDERFVPPDHSESNFGMVRETLLSRVAIPRDNIHPIATVGLSPEAAAADYERELQAWYGAAQLEPARPLFDATLLGLGTDGHTASLFPGSAALDERRHWVAAVIGAKPEPRITLTYTALEASRDVAFLVAGADKRAILARLRAGAPELPAGRLRPSGAVHYFLDRAAAPEG
jgi:6-phosphogluconolactonase